MCVTPMLNSYMTYNDNNKFFNKKICKATKCAFHTQINKGDGNVKLQVVFIFIQKK